MDPSKVLAGGIEWANLIAGSPLARYSTMGTPPNPNTAPNANNLPDLRHGWSFGGSALTPRGFFAHTWAQVDFNGNSPVFAMPAAGSTVPFPTFAGAFTNGNAAERATAIPNVVHAGAYNPFTHVAGNRIFGASHMEALLRFGSTNSAAVTSDFLRLCPTNFMVGANARRQVTSVSGDFAVPGLTPMMWDVSTASGNNYGYAAKGPGSDPNFPPTGTTPAFTSVTNLVAGTLPASTEFNLNRRSLHAAIGRLDLNRFLPPYPHMGHNTKLQLGTCSGLCQSIRFGLQFGPSYR
jgi:hypothetical protein